MRAGRLFVDLLPAAVWAVLPLAGMVQDLKMGIHLFPGNQRNYLVQVIQPMYSYLKEEMQKKNAAGALAEHVYKKVPPARPPFPAVFLLLIKLVVSPLPHPARARPVGRTTMTSTSIFGRRVASRKSTPCGSMRST